VEAAQVTVRSIPEWRSEYFHLMMAPGEEDSHGLIVHTEVFQANGTAERDAALVMLEKLAAIQPVTVGADKGFDTRD
jgi:hypothetical protein